MISHSVPLSELVSPSAEAFKFFLQSDNIINSDILAMSGSTTLREVDFSGCNNLTDESLMSLSTCHQLRDINLSGCNALTSLGSKCFSKFPNLENLYLNHLEWVNDVTLIALRSCPNLQKLSLIDTKSLNDIHYSKMALCGQNIHTLDISDNPQLRGTVFIYLKRSNLPKLKHLFLDNNKGIAHDCWSAFENIAPLRTLSCNGCSQLDHVGLCALWSQSSSLQVFSMRDCNRLNAECESFLSPFAVLESLSLSWSFQGEHMVRFCQNISTLDISHATISDVSIIEISSLPGLERFAANYCPNLLGTCFKFWKKRPSRITMLSLNSCPSLQIGDLLLNLPDVFPALSLLKLGSCPAIVRDEWKQIAHPGLKELEVAFNPLIDDSHLNAWAVGCPSLRHLGVQGCANISRHGIASMGSLSIDWMECSKIPASTPLDRLDAMDLKRH